MANILKGKAVADAINVDLINRVNNLKNKNIVPTLAILRVGEKGDDLSYERGATKRCNDVGINIKNIVLPIDVEKETFYNELEKLNRDPEVHGILMFRPLPKELDNELARTSINPIKDVDGCTDSSLIGVFTNTKLGFAPCTAEAAVEMLDYYGIDITGKNITVIGRSLVIGKPVSMLLLNRNATVTICHTKSVDMPSITNKADIVIVAVGKCENFSKEYFKEGQTVIDVGINWNEEKQKLCGDVKFEEVEPIVENISPVPGGVGSITTAILCRHVVEAAERAIQ